MGSISRSNRQPARRSPRAVGILLAALAIVVGTYGVSQLRTLTATHSAAPIASPAADGAQPPAGIAVPGEVAIAGGSLPADAPLAQLDHNIGLWAKNLAANDHDYLSASNLATLYHGRGRLTAQLADHERALDAAWTAIRIAPTYTPARDLEAAILFTLHDFTTALQTADDVLATDPSDLGARGTRFDAELELGRIDAARVDLGLLSAAASGPAIQVRQARLASVTGDPAAALASSKAAQSAAVADEASATDLGFYAYAVGEYARLAGDAPAARSAYRDALAERDTDLASIVGLARIDAFDGSLDPAIAGLQQAAAIAPQPETLSLLGDLLTQRAGPGDLAAAAKQFATVRFIEQLGTIQGQVYDRQILRFELDHDGDAVALVDRARASLAARPDWTGHDTLAWALYRAARPSEAAAEVAAARALGADDARLRFHEGAIDLAAGRTADGRAMLRSALALGPALDPIERAEAAQLLGG
jgi:tetratricopeptide (TPR) repeat protein